MVEDNSQVLKYVCVNVTHGSISSYAQVLQNVYVNVTWWKIILKFMVQKFTFSSSPECLCKCYMVEDNSQVLKNVCVNVTHGSRSSHSQVLQNV
jgi:hypothetical protein